MQEGLIFTMDVGKEMLGTLWQIEDGLQVDNLSTRLCYCWERLREQLQISHVLFYIIMFHVFFHFLRAFFIIFVLKLYSYNYYVDSNVFFNKMDVVAVIGQSAYKPVFGNNECSLSSAKIQQKIENQ